MRGDVVLTRPCQTHETRGKVETGKFSLGKKKKRPGPKKQNDSIEEAKKILLAASFHTT